MLTPPRVPRLGPARLPQGTRDDRVRKLEARQRPPPTMADGSRRPSPSRSSSAFAGDGSGERSPSAVGAVTDDPCHHARVEVHGFELPAAPGRLAVRAEG